MDLMHYTCKIPVFCSDRCRLFPGRSPPNSCRVLVLCHRPDLYYLALPIKNNSLKFENSFTNYPPLKLPLPPNPLKFSISLSSSSLAALLSRSLRSEVVIMALLFTHIRPSSSLKYWGFLRISSLSLMIQFPFSSLKHLWIESRTGWGSCQLSPDVNSRSDKLEENRGNNFQHKISRSHPNTRWDHTNSFFSL